MPPLINILAQTVTFDKNGLIPAVVQQHDSGEVLMMAWMNAESLARTIETGRAVYWSRSRQCLWTKGETSGHTQHIHNIYIDCDTDTLLLHVHQVGAACHTGERTCFYRSLSANGRIKIKARDSNSV